MFKVVKKIVIYIFVIYLIPKICVSTTKVTFANAQNICKPSEPITLLFRNTAFIATANYGQKTVIIKWKNRCTGNTC